MARTSVNKLPSLVLPWEEVNFTTEENGVRFSITENPPTSKQPTNFFAEEELISNSLKNH